MPKTLVYDINFKHIGAVPALFGRVTYRLPINATSVEYKTFKSYLGSSSSSTIKRKFNSLKRFLDWRHKEGYRKQKLPESIKLPKFQTLSPTWLTRNEFYSKNT